MCLFGCIGYIVTAPLSLIKYTPIGPSWQAVAWVGRDLDASPLALVYLQQLTEKPQPESRPPCPDADLVRIGQTSIETAQPPA